MMKPSWQFPLGHAAVDNRLFCLLWFQAQLVRLADKERSKSASLPRGQLKSFRPGRPLVVSDHESRRVVDTPIVCYHCTLYDCKVQKLPAMAQGHKNPINTKDRAPLVH